MNESESLGLHSFNEPSDPLSAREAAGEERREQFSLEERLKQSQWKLCSSELPDSDTTVLGYNAKWIDPVWPVFHDGEDWCEMSGLLLTGRDYGTGEYGELPPTHWMHFPEPPLTK